MTIFNEGALPVSVLCVDDEVSHRIIIQRLLSRFVDTVILAEDGRAGHAAFVENRPDIVITDLMMPHLNGLEMSRAIRGIDPEVPIILMTSSSSMAFLSEAIDIGISQFLPKPILKDKLISSLERCYSMIDMQRRLKSEQERTLILSSALEQSPTAVIIVDVCGTIDFMNHVCVGRYGWHIDALQGKDLLQMKLSEELNQLIAASLDGLKHVSAEIDLALPDGEPSIAIANVSVFSAAGSATKLLVTLDDITEKRIMEKHLLRSQKLESLGVLAGGIAHNFNNILTAIIGNAELAIMRLPPESSAVTSLDNIKTSALRAARLSQQMLAFSGRGDRVCGEVDLHAMLEDMLSVLEVSVSRQVKICFDHAAGALHVKADTFHSFGE